MDIRLNGKTIPQSFFKLSKGKFMKFVLTPDFLKGKTVEEKEKIVGDCWESVNKKPIEVSEEKPKAKSKTK